MSKVNRRTVLKGLGALAAAPALTGCKPEEIPDLTIEALRERIDTVVVLMMENRSFDHVFGALTLEEGRDDVEGLRAEHTNTLPDGTVVAPFPAEIDCLADPPHGWSSCHAQWNGGDNSGFASEFEARAPGMGQHALGYLNRDWQPISYALADQGVLCDHWYSSVLSSTWPNRFYSHCASSGGERTNEFPSESLPSLYTRLSEAGIDWRGYFSVLPFLALVDDKGEDPLLSPIEQFFEDAANGELPAVTIVEPPYGSADDHPPAHPLAGQIFIGQVVQALMDSPQYERCLFILTYDEHGGFHDHVGPPTAADDYADQGFDQLGIRVPSVLVGPWCKRGHVSHDVYDHTSIIALVSRLFDLDPLTARDAAANTLFDAFDPEAIFRGEPHPPLTMPTVDADEDVIYRDECHVSSGFRSFSGHTGQPELEAFADEHLVGTPLDRRDEVPEVLQWLLDKARAQGIYRPR